MEHKKTHPSTKFRFTFSQVEPSQKELIHRWLSQDHIKQWLHGDGLRKALEDLDNSFHGTSWGQHWIAYDQDTPFGYLLTSNVGDNVITLDLFICDVNYLGKGLSVQMIEEFLLSQFPNVDEVLIDPEATNARAIHVYEKVGFRTFGQFIAEWHPVPHLKMRLKMRELIQKSLSPGNKMIEILKPSPLNNRVSTGLFILRLVAGLAFMHHGFGKIQNPWGWMGADSTVPAIFQFLAAISEFGGGFLWILGLLTPIASFGIFWTMTVAVSFHLFVFHDPFVASAAGQGSYELASIFVSVALLLLLAGPGRFSLDRLLFGEKTWSR